MTFTEPLPSSRLSAAASCSGYYHTGASFWLVDADEPHTKLVPQQVKTAQP